MEGFEWEKAGVPNQGVGFVDGVSQLVVGVVWGQLEFEDQAVDFIDTERDRELFLDCVFDEAFGVQHDLTEEKGLKL